MGCDGFRSRRLRRCAMSRNAQREKIRSHRMVNALGKVRRAMTHEPIVRAGAEDGLCPSFRPRGPRLGSRLLRQTTGSVRASQAGFEQLMAATTSRASSDGSLGGVPLFQDGGLLTHSRIRRRLRTIRRIEHRVARLHRNADVNKATTVGLVLALVIAWTSLCAARPSAP